MQFPCNIERMKRARAGLPIGPLYTELTDMAELGAQ